LNAETRPRLRQAVIVEGKYDKIKLETVVDALIIVTDGFRIFKDKEMRVLIRKLAEKSGIVVITDSDAAGFLIRRHLTGIVPADTITNVYIPELCGKEPRKAHASREGKLGVEGMPPAVLLDALRRAGLLDEEGSVCGGITKTDLYDAGLSGGTNSAAMRRALLGELGLPGRISAGALPEVLSRLMDRDELFAMCERITALPPAGGM